MSKLITFAVPCYNSAAYMEHCVETLLTGGEDIEIILVDDTQEYAVRGMRLHCTDFILRPVEFRHIVRSMNLALRGWM